MQRIALIIIHLIEVIGGFNIRSKTENKREGLKWYFEIIVAKTAPSFTEQLLLSHKGKNTEERKTVEKRIDILIVFWIWIEYWLELNIVSWKRGVRTREKNLLIWTLSNLGKIDRVIEKIAWSDQISGLVNHKISSKFFKLGSNLIIFGIFPLL